MGAFPIFEDICETAGIGVYSANGKIRTAEIKFGVKDYHDSQPAKNHPVSSPPAGPYGVHLPQCFLTAL